MRPLIAALLLVLSAPVVASPQPAEDVSFITKDGLKIAGTLHPSGRKGAAGVVALPMYRHDRTTWTPVAGRFAKAGIDFLAIDLRGHGDSAAQGEEDLSKRVEARDPELFNAMWQDALAARSFLISRGADPDRIGLLGASVGCSVAIDAGGREPDIPGVCLMTPGKKYLDVDTMEDLAAWGKRPMLILSSKEEAEGGATAIRDAVGRSAELVLFDGKRIHGTGMFGTVPGVEDRVVRWFDGLLCGAVALDGRLDDLERPRHALGKTEGFSLSAVPRHGRWHVAAVPAEGGAVPRELELALKAGDHGWSIRWSAGGGTWLRQLFRDGKWAPYRTRAGRGPGPRAARGEAVEMLVVPWGGLEPSPELRVRVTAKVGDREVSSGWQPLPK